MVYIITPESAPVLRDFDAAKAAMAERALQVAQSISMDIGTLALIERTPPASMGSDVLTRIEKTRGPVFDTHSTRHLELLPYVVLRPSRYGAIDDLREECPVLADRSSLAKVTLDIIHREHVTADTVPRFIDPSPEYSDLVISQEGSLALVTHHTHDKKNPYSAMTSSELDNDALFDSEAIENGYTPAHAFADFLEDLENINVFGSNTDNMPELEPRRKSGGLRLFRRG